MFRFRLDKERKKAAAHLKKTWNTQLHTVLGSLSIFCYVTNYLWQFSNCQVCARALIYNIDRHYYVPFPVWPLTCIKLEAIPNSPTSRLKQVYFCEHINIKCKNIHFIYAIKNRINLLWDCNKLTRKMHQKMKVVNTFKL